MGTKASQLLCYFRVHTRHKGRLLQPGAKKNSLVGADTRWMSPLSLGPLLRVLTRALTLTSAKRFFTPQRPHAVAARPIFSQTFRVSRLSEEEEEDCRRQGRRRRPFPIDVSLARCE